jgi:hypothetical protein
MPFSQKSKHEDREHLDMSKIKALFGFAVMVGLLAITASSAFALFSSENGKATKGSGSAGKTIFTDQTASVECEKAVGTWKLTKGAKGSEVETGTEAENLRIHIAASTAKPAGWESCSSSIGKSTSAEVGECELEVKETAKVPKGIGKGLAAVVTSCVATSPGNCRIKILSANGMGVNEKLEEVLNEDVGTSLLSKIDVKGIASEAEELGGVGCSGINKTELKNKVGTEKGEVTGALLKQV